MRARRRPAASRPSPAAWTAAASVADTCSRGDADPAAAAPRGAARPRAAGAAWYDHARPMSGHRRRRHGGRIAGVVRRTTADVRPRRPAATARGRSLDGPARRAASASHIETGPIRGQIALLAAAAADARAVVNCGLDYLVPRADGRLLVGSTIEDAGFDRDHDAGGDRAAARRGPRPARRRCPRRPSSGRGRATARLGGRPAVDRPGPGAATTRSSRQGIFGRACTSRPARPCSSPT